jgi:hypothetical protein
MQIVTDVEYVVSVRQDLVGFAQAMVIGRTFYLLLSFTFIGMLVSRSPRAATPASAPPAE